MRILSFLFVVLLFALPSQAQTPVPVITGDFKDLKHTSSARIDKVIDGQTILMKDGKIVRLSGLFYPFATGKDQSRSMVNAKEKLERVLPENTEVMLYQTRYEDKGRVNRMGHHLAHLVIKKTGEWVNGAMVAYGYGYALTDLDNPQMVHQLYILEDLSRMAQKGLWKTGSGFDLLTPETAIQGDGTFRVVEGVVAKAATSSNNLYLNFGDDWRKDFTVKVSSAQRKVLSRKGIDPMALNGHTVRVRGWLREWNGPYMELDSIDQLEIVAAPPVVQTPPPMQEMPEPAAKAGQVNP